MSNASLGQLTGLAKRLVLEQYTDIATATQLTEQAQTQNLSLITLLVQHHVVPARTLAEMMAHDFGLPLLDLNAFQPTCLPTDYAHEQLISRYHAVPLYQRGEQVTIALSDPSQPNTLQAFTFSSGRTCHAIVVEDDKLTSLIHRIIGHQSIERLASAEAKIPSSNLQSTISTSIDDAPVVRFVNQLLQDAVKRSVSDIHFEIYDQRYRIRFRRDGVLYQAAIPPANMASQISARIKVMARLDIAERRLPQDGQFHINVAENHPIHCRVNTCPTTSGEKVVIRLLDPKQSMMTMDALGYEDFQHALLLQHINRPQGMVLVTGPTGSGKTVSLYAALNQLNTTERNIMTIEDPVEIHIPGINQVNVHKKAGLTFNGALRAFLRQDPDVIMVGEIRDGETAETAMRAAQTGHLVLSTLHTNNAAETLTRLMHMGVAPFHIASSVTLIVAQRLARRLCHHCRRQDTLTQSELIVLGLTTEEAKQANLYQAYPKGCQYCNHGFDGQVGLYEMLTVSLPIAEAIMQGAHAITIAKLALQEGMQPLRRSGIHKALAGITSLQEVLRVTEV